MHDDCDSCDEEENAAEEYCTKATAELPKINGCDLKQRTKASDSSGKNHHKKQNSNVQSTQKSTSSKLCTDSGEDTTSNIKVEIALLGFFFSDSMPVRALMKCPMPGMLSCVCHMF